MNKRIFIVGLFVLSSFLGLGALGISTFLRSDFFKDWVVIYTTFEDSFGLKSGNEVTLRGQKVGYVEQIYLKKDYVLVEMKIYKDHQEFINKSYVAELLQKNFVVGDWWISLYPEQNDNRYVMDNDTLASDLPIHIDKTVEKGTRLVETVEVIFKHIMDGKGVLGDLYVSDSLADIAKGLGTNANKLLKTTDKFFDKANNTVYKLDTLIDEISVTAGKGDNAIDTLIVLANSLNTSVVSANILVNELSKTPKDIGYLIQNLDSVVSEIDTVFKALERHWILRGYVEDLRDERKK